MINNKEYEKMLNQKLYNPYKVNDASFKNVHIAQKKDLMNQIFGKMIVP